MKQKGIIQNKTFDSSIIANQCKDEKYELEKSLLKELRWDMMRPDEDVDIKKLKKELGK